MKRTTTPYYHEEYQRERGFKESSSKTRTRVDENQQALKDPHVPIGLLLK